MYGGISQFLAQPFLRPPPPLSDTATASTGGARHGDPDTLSASAAPKPAPPVCPWPTTDCLDVQGWGRALRLRQRPSAQRPLPTARVQGRASRWWPSAPPPPSTACVCGEGDRHRVGVRRRPCLQRQQLHVRDGGITDAVFASSAVRGASPNHCAREFSKEAGTESVSAAVRATTVKDATCVMGGAAGTVSVSAAT